MTRYFLAFLAVVIGLAFVTPSATADKCVAKFTVKEVLNGNSGDKDIYFIDGRTKQFSSVSKEYKEVVHLAFITQGTLCLLKGKVEKLTQGFVGNLKRTVIYPELMSVIRPENQAVSVQEKEK
jgi:hypothetical protein